MYFLYKEVVGQEDEEIFKSESLVEITKRIPKDELSNTVTFYIKSSDGKICPIKTLSFIDWALEFLDNIGIDL